VGNDYVGDTKTLDVHIKRLRSLIEEDPKSPTHITTVRGVGYRFELMNLLRDGQLIAHVGSEHVGQLH